MARYGARLTMSGYVYEILTTSGVTGTARIPASDTLLELDESEDVRVWFHRAVAHLLYLAKRTRPECLAGVLHLATRVTRCTVRFVGKLHQMVRYIRWTADLGVVLRPGVLSMLVRIYVDASYGVESPTRDHAK